MCGPGCKMFLLNPVYLPLEIHYRQVVPYLVLGYRKVKNIYVYVRIGLTIIFSFWIGFWKVKTNDLSLLTPVPWLTQSLFCFVFPKLLGAQICTGSQVVGIFQIHLEALKAGGFIS